MNQPVSPAAETAAVLMPELLLRNQGVVRLGHLVAHPRHWQEPAATERAAYEEMLEGGSGPDGYAYLGFPWATLIDGLRADATVAFELMAALEPCRRALPSGMCIATVVQHIYADRYAPILRACGVTDLFWSHARRGQDRLQGMRLHPFPLFPAQTPDGPDPADPHRPRRWLANFIGAHDPKVYLTDVRGQIFADADRFEDVLIIRRRAWHFERAVYEQQVGGRNAEEARLADEAKARDEYLAAIRDSTFTLCPSGSGPNSIRIFESLALSSIPIILTRTLALPGEQALWERTCILEEDSAEGYRRALAKARAMPDGEIRDRQAGTQALFAQVGPAGWKDLIHARMHERNS